MAMAGRCPACGAGAMDEFYRLEGVPVHSVLLLRTREEALSYPRGDIALGFCRTCGFISNLAFEEGLHEYSAEYEASQAFSPTFNAFAQRLAERLVREYDLHGKEIIEIGCGQGEFLELLCALGDNRGVGFDPAYIPGRTDLHLAGGEGGVSRVRVIPDFYSEQYADLRADFVVCKMTLEHIHDVCAFVGTVRRSLAGSPDATVFFQVPDVARILQEQAFWDVYYEHCSYFGQGSLARLFRRSGFDVLKLAREYGDQYLMIEARPAAAHAAPALPQEEDLADLRQAVDAFPQRVQANVARWRERLARVAERGGRAVIWGSGSKGVAFLTALGVRDEVRYAVDINPKKAGTYMAGTGQEIVPPEFLREYRPDVVIVMNPVYRAEIAADLGRMGLQPELLTV